MQFGGERESEKRESEKREREREKRERERASTSFSLARELKKWFKFYFIIQAHTLKTNKKFI